MKRSFLVLLAATTLLLGEDQPAKKYELQSMTPEQLDKELSGKQRYDFDIAPEDGLIDSTGRTIRAAELPEYLKSHALAPGAAYFLWITPNSAPLNTLAPTVKPLGDYGVTKIVVRHKPEAVTNNRNTPTTAPTKERPEPKKTIVLQGKPNPGAIDSTGKFPQLEGRPAELRPEPLPRPVRYKFASDEAVVAAAKRAEGFLLSPATPPGTLFGSSAFIQSGAWIGLRDAGLAIKPAQSFHNQVRLKRGTISLDGALVRDPEDCKAIVIALRKMIQADGGGKVRAFHSNEMALWWVFISFDIEEPCLILETTGGRYRFVLGFTDKGLLVLDELNGLPDPKR